MFKKVESPEPESATPSRLLGLRASRWIPVNPDALDSFCSSFSGDFAGTPLKMLELHTAILDCCPDSFDSQLYLKVSNHRLDHIIYAPEQTTLYVVTEFLGCGRAWPVYDVLAVAYTGAADGAPAKLRVDTFNDYSCVLLLDR